MPEQLEARGISCKSYTAPPLGPYDSPFPAFRQFRTNPTLNRLGIQPTYPADFEADLARDQLPAVSWVQVNSRNPSIRGSLRPRANTPSITC